MADNDDLVQLLVAIVAIALVVPILMTTVAWPMMGMWGGGHMGSGAMWDGVGTQWIWFGMWGVLLLILLGGGFLLYRVAGRAENDGTDAAVEELRIAYAEGELSDDEFEERRNRLRRREERDSDRT